MCETVIEGPGPSILGGGLVEDDYFSRGALRVIIFYTECEDVNASMSIDLTYDLIFTPTAKRHKPITFILNSY